jgi:N-glycosidase YbiA
MAIDNFREENFYLSNMYQFEQGIVTPDGVEVHTSEQLYLPPRFVEEAARKVIQQAGNGFEAKAVAGVLKRTNSPTRPDWFDIRVSKMRDAVMVKFAANPDIRQQLVETGDEELIEGNDRGDRFWGVAPDGNGENMLGHILMDTRAALQSPDFSVDIDSLVHRIFS